MGGKASTTPLLGWFDIYVGNCGYSHDGMEFVTDVPIGVELDVPEAERSAPVSVGEMPWETKSLYSAQGRKENGRFRMWHSASGEEVGDRPLCPCTRTKTR